MRDYLYQRVKSYDSCALIPNLKGIIGESPCDMRDLEIYLGNLKYYPEISRYISLFVRLFGDILSNIWYHR